MGTESPPPSSPHIYTQRIWILKIANYGGCFLILSWSRFRISLLLSIKNDVKCACRKLHSAVHTCIYPKTPGHTSKKVHNALEGKKTLNDAPSHHANALTQQLCMHTTNHCAMTTSRRCAVDNSTSYNALSRKHNFAQNADGLSHNASLLLGLLSRCRAVKRVFTSLPQHVIALKYTAI